MKNRIFILFILLSLLACGKTPPGTASKNLPTYRIGYMICNSEKETLQRFLPFSKYLGEKMGVKFETVALDTINFSKEIDNLDFVHTNSLLYIMLHRFHGVDVAAVENKGSLGTRSQGIIIALKTSGIKKVADLKGKRMIFGPTLAPTGFMSQIDLLQRHGINPEDDLAFYTIPKGSFKHEKVIYGVLFGKYDAGAIPLDDLETMAADDRIDANDFVIVGRAPQIPYCNFAVTEKIDDDLATKFKNTILAITKDDTVEYEGETVRVLKRALVAGYEATNNADFDIVRDIAKRTNMPPYQKF